MSVVSKPAKKSQDRNLFKALATFFAVALGVLGSTVDASAEDRDAPGLGQAASKDQYHLFNPTPSAAMREFITDRPDRTESPYTVDAGHFQFETDLFILNRDQGQSTYGWNIFNAKVGTTNRSDLQVIFETVTKDAVSSGYGNTTLRFKYNIFGNDGGPSALGIMPYLKIPTKASSREEKRTEGGVILPFAFDGVSGFSFGSMIQWDFIANEDDRGYHGQFISSLTVGHDLILGTEGYLELYSQTEKAAGKEWVATVDAGILIPVSDNLRFDLGANIGVTEAADDLNPFVGFSGRF
ncbi:MAG: hypothetical protein RJB38_376 [Pseudomonadota bacterium]|jgi:hypothetical protein